MTCYGCDLVKQNGVEVGDVGNKLLSFPLNVGDIEPPSEPIVLAPVVPVEHLCEVVKDEGCLVSCAWLVDNSTGDGEIRRI
ncbi:hypothetical protein MA16_Dca002754 [Dendrobium catenatum]|uniref:Uncharacterized protein n=1 Tax=Dendrobium catenatum TaxID=906689 RepID=A0A2I0X8L9_9ASPA|nr:hypothetical protein MA16_Dca002754 [Dendrobium catenatum]